MIPNKGISMFVGSRIWSAKVLTLVFASLLATHVCCHPGDASSDSSGKQAVGKVVDLFSVWQGKDSVAKEAAKLIDYEEMSEKALGAQWEKLKPLERVEFVSTFRNLIEERYYERWHRLFNRAELAYKTEVSDSGDLLIKTLMTVGKKRDVVVWRLSNRSGNYRVISIAVNENDMLDRLSARLEQRLRRGSFKALLTWMREEADEDSKSSQSNVAPKSISKVPQKLTISNY